jgi:hypothetical protein
VCILLRNKAIKECSDQTLSPISDDLTSKCMLGTSSVFAALPVARYFSGYVRNVCVCVYSCEVSGSWKCLVSYVMSLLQNVCLEQDPIFDIFNRCFVCSFALVK